MSAHNFEDLSGNIYGHLKVIRFNRDTGKWICECDCGNKTTVEKKAGHLKLKDRIQSCGCANNMKFIDLSNKRFEHLVVKEYSKELVEWLCECDCGRQVYKKSVHLRNGNAKYCGFNDCEYKKIKYKDLTNNRFGNIIAIKQEGQSNWLCKCDCGNTKIIRASNLINGSTTSCGCLNSSKIINIKNERFGHLKAIEHIYRGTWLCECDCGNICEKESYDLRKNRVTSCGCVRNKSNKETEVYDYIKSIYQGEIIRNNRDILKGKEIDIYIPDKKIGIEFNGNYWHSLKEKIYHQNKTIESAKMGIQLINIFEYEWDNENTRNKLKSYLYSILSNNKNKIYARNTIIKEIESEEAKDFLNKYHLQGSVNSSINIGCIYNNEIIGVITFGKPRFNKDYDFELHRLCWVPTIIVIGGLQKMFNYFIKYYNKHSIITYCDISKFTGNSYLKIGFNVDKITEPSYVWVSHHGNDIKTRYQTQKHKLLKKGFGDERQTEDEIMRELGYYKVYDCGNIRLNREV